MTKRELNKLTQARNRLLNMKSRKLSILERENPDTYQGVLWLRENRDKFKKPVHEPIMLCLDVKSPDYARYVETHVGRADLEGFVCEDPDDVNLLLRELREIKKLRKINAFHSNPIAKETFSPRLDEAKLSSYGFVTYLSNMYDAPPAVNAYLCQQKLLHQVPLFKEETDMTDQLKNHFNSYYISTKKFTSKKSKYSNEISTGMEDIGSKRVIRLADNIDQGRLEEVEKELLEKEKTLKNNEGRVKAQDVVILNLKQAMNDVSKQVHELESKKKEFHNWSRDLTLKENMLVTLLEPKCNIEEEKRRIKVRKAELVVKLCKAIRGTQELTAACSQLDLRKRCLQLQLQNVESEYQESTDNKSELEK